MKKKTIDLFRNIAKKTLKPIPKITVSTWADSYRILSSDSSAEPGKWNTARAPYQKEIMDAFTSDGVHKVVVQSAAQIGKSDIMLNVIARFAHIDPSPMMMIQPTIEMAQDFSKSRVAPMIRDTPILNELFFEDNKEAKTRNSNNTILNKVFPGGRLVMAGANSPAGLASRPIRLLLSDEVDRFPKSAGNEGDPIALAEKRMTTFWNYLEGLFSTPTIKGDSRIEVEYLNGTQEEWQHMCPNCKEYHLLRYSDMIVDSEKYLNKKKEIVAIIHSVKWCCPDCGFSFEENEMKASNQKYVINNAPALKNGVRSFFINGFTSTWISWKDIMKEWLEAGDDPQRKKVVVNTRFGETFEETGCFDNENVFLARREYYNAELADGVLILTASVDVQDNRLEYEICGWGIGEECWGIKKGVIMGSPDTDKVWQELDLILDRTYHFKNGQGLIVARTFIDSGGHYSESVYKYCHKNMVKQRFAIKGSSVHGVPLIHKYGKSKKSPIVLIVMLGTETGKQLVMERLAIEEIGQRYFHFPLDDKDNINITENLHTRGYDTIYFKGLISEKLVRRVKNGSVYMVWEHVNSKTRNEPLDLRVYNLACIKSINPDWEQLSEVIAGNNTTKTKNKTKINKKRPKYGNINRGVEI